MSGEISDLNSSINNLVNSLYDSTPTIFYDGFSDGNTKNSNPSTFPYILITNHVDLTLVTSLRINCYSGGTLNIGKIEKENITSPPDLTKIIYLTSIEITPGNNEYILTPPIAIKESEYIVLGSINNTCAWKYGPNGNNKIFYYLYQNDWVLSSSNSVGIGIYGLSLETGITSVLSNKKISIYGDSISTFAGWIPSGNVTYYTGRNAGVTHVDQTWWKKVINALSMELVVNNSWSGRTVSDTTESNAGYKMENILQLQENNTTPEIILIKLGINDFNRGFILGSYDGSTAPPVTPSNFLDAYAIMLNNIMTTYPLADVYCCMLMPCERTGATGFPEINSQGDTISQWNSAIAKLAYAFGAKILHHNTCGLTYYNLSEYMGDYTQGAGLHPNAAGHSLIANQTIHEMDNAVRTRY